MPKETELKLSLIAAAEDLRHDGFRRDTVERIQDYVSALHGNTLAVLHELWIEKESKQNRIAKRLGISNQAVSKIVHGRDLKRLKLYLMQRAEIEGYEEEQPRADISWMYANEPEHDNYDTYETLDTPSGQTGEVVNLRNWVRAGWKADPYVGSTNGNTFGLGKSGDDMAAEAMKEYRREKKLEKKAR